MLDKFPLVWYNVLTLKGIFRIRRMDMKYCQIYSCETCGFESKNKNEVLLCEAKHLGLSTVEEYLEWGQLKNCASGATGALYSCNNQAARDKEEVSYNNLFKFEKEHNMYAKYNK